MCLDVLKWSRVITDLKATDVVTSFYGLLCLLPLSALLIIKQISFWCLMQNIRMECVYALTSYRHIGQADITLLFEYTLIIIGNYRKVTTKLRRHSYKITYSSVAYCLRVANFGTI